MTDILLALIAGILAVKLVIDIHGNEDAVLLTVTIPTVLFLIVVAGAVIFGIAFGFSALVSHLGISL